MSIQYYEIETAICGAGDDVSVVKLDSAFAAEQQIIQLPDLPFFVLVAAVGDGIDYGNFLMWSTDGRAIIRLHEHREFTALLPGQSGSGNQVVSFFDPDGSALVEAYENTIPHQLANDALCFWLKTNQRLPELHWQ